jgi:hypothetical protein
VSIDPEVILPAEMNFRSAISGPQLVILDNRKIHGSLLISHIGRSLDEHIACHITHPREAIVIVFRSIIRIAEEGKTEQEETDKN